MTNSELFFAAFSFLSFPDNVYYTQASSEDTNEAQLLDEVENKEADEVCQKISKESSAGLKSETSEIISQRPRLRVKNDTIRMSQAVGPLGSKSESLLCHRGPTSSVVSFGVCVVIVMFLGYVGLWRGALDIFVA